jgi:hypothetical protein
VRPRWIVVALLLLAAAVVASLLASDVSAWRTALTRGDARFAESPASARWRADPVLPFDPARRILGIGDQLKLRSATQRFFHVRAAGNGLDNGYIESQQRGALETVLSGLGSGPDAERDSDAELMLGILSYMDSHRQGPGAPASPNQAVAAFQSAVLDDPANANAKLDLELLLRYLQAKGTRTGSNGSSAGPAKGHKGAGGAQPGSGY